jgi:hypothetical protein
VDIEKTIEFILSHQANAEVQMEKIREGMAAHAAAHAAALTAQAEAQTAALAAQAEAQAKGHAEHDRRMAEHDRAMAEHDRAIAEHHRVMAIIDARLNRAIRLGVQDARAQRKRNQEFDEKMTQLSAAQLVTEEKMQVTEEKLQRFIDSMQRGTNGHN